MLSGPQHDRRYGRTLSKNLLVDIVILGARQKVAETEASKFGTQAV